MQGTWGMRLSGAAATIAAALLIGAAPASAQPPFPILVHDVKTGASELSDLVDPMNIQNLVQPDTQTEPSVAVNPQNPLNVVAVYQEGRRANGGDATNGYATSFDGGATWVDGELPGLTTYPGQTGTFERASDAVVAFGPDNLVYANSLVFDQDTSNGLRSGMAVNVSKDGGRTWGNAVVFQDDQLGGTNDKNWIVVDNSDAPGHTKGRVYVVWDRVAPVVYQYCDKDCDQKGNWLPTFDTLSPVVFPGQGIGAYPIIMDNGGLGIVLGTLSAGVPTNPDEPDEGSNNQVFISAPTAGRTPFPAPLQFLPPVQIATNGSNGTASQRAAEGLPAAAADPNRGTLYAVWDDARFRSDGVNDAVISRSTDNGQTWSVPARVNPGPKDDKVNHYNVTVAVGEDGKVSVDYRQRDQSSAGPLFTPRIDSYHQQSTDAGRTWTDPLLIDSVPSNPWYGAFSRNGTFEGDYNQTASVGGYTYVTRAKGRPAFNGEPQPLTAVKDSKTQVELTGPGIGHQHQSNWVALIRDVTSGRDAPAGSGEQDLAPQALIKKNGLRARKAKRRRATGIAKDDHQVVRVEVAVVRKRRNRCRELLASGKFSKARRCRRPRSFLLAKGTTKWTFKLRRRLKRGYYVVYARAIDNTGRQQSSFGTKSRRPFRVR